MSFFSLSVKLWCFEKNDKKSLTMKQHKTKKPFSQFSTGVRLLTYLYESSRYRLRVLEDSMTLSRCDEMQTKGKKKRN